MVAMFMKFPVKSFKCYAIGSADSLGWIPIRLEFNEVSENRQLNAIGKDPLARAFKHLDIWVSTGVAKKERRQLIPTMWYTVGFVISV